MSGVPVGYVAVEVEVEEGRQSLPCPLSVQAPVSRLLQVKKLSADNSVSL